MLQTTPSPIHVYLNNILMPYVIVVYIFLVCVCLNKNTIFGETFYVDEILSFLNHGC